MDPNLLPLELLGSFVPTAHTTIIRGHFRGLKQLLDHYRCRKGLFLPDCSVVVLVELWFRCLLSLTQDNHKLSYIQQLRPTQTIQPRIKLKLFGHSGAGKSTLLESLKCGILRSFFRRRRTRMTNTARHPNSPINSKPPGR